MCVLSSYTAKQETKWFQTFTKFWCTVLQRTLLNCMRFQKTCMAV
jgi:hypothetical protein